MAYLIYFYKNDTPEDSENVIYKMINSEISEILSDVELWQSDLTDMTEMITEFYNKIESLGAKGAMEWILS